MRHHLALLLAIALAVAAFPPASAERALTPTQVKKLITEYFTAEPQRQTEIADTIRNLPPLSKKEAEKWQKTLSELASKALTDQIRKKLGNDFDKFAKSGVFEVEAGGIAMKYFYRTGGKQGKNGNSLYINLHGGGNDKGTNDSAWEGAKGQYSVDGCLFVPRAPKDEVLSWAIPEMFPLLDQILKEAFVLRGVDPDRVFVLGYSMGGWGTLLLGPAFADRFAAVGSSAGGEHAQRANPQNLYNTPIIIQIGTEDHAFQRYALTKAYADRLAELHKESPNGYKFEYREHEGKGHAIDDAANPKWMGEHTRNPYPERLVWTHVEVPGWDNSRFYYIAVDSPSGASIDLERKEGTFKILKRSRGKRFTIYLNDEMTDLNRPILVEEDGEVLFKGAVTRKLVTMVETFAERFDHRSTFSASVEIR